MWDDEWEINYWYTVKLCSIRTTLRHTELGIILKEQDSNIREKMFKWSSHISVLVIRPRRRWRESLSFCLAFFHEAHLILLLCVLEVLNLLAPHSSWCWDVMATEAACDWQVTLAAQIWSASETVTQVYWCQTCLSIQGTAYVGLMYDGAQEITLLFKWFWACKPGIGVLPPPLPVLGVKIPWSCF